MLVVHSVTMDFLCSLCAVFCPCNIRGLRPNLPVSFLPSGALSDNVKMNILQFIEQQHLVL